MVFTRDGVPTWEVRRRVKARGDHDDLIDGGTADKFEAAKAAALFEGNALLRLRPKNRRYRNGADCNK